MKHNILTTLRRAVCLAGCLLLIGSFLLLCCAAGDETVPVKVGFFSFDGYHMQTGNETDGYARSGYGYEMLEHLAGYGGMCYSYVGYDKSWNEMLDMLDRGEIDLLTSAQKTPEREALFDFSDANIGISTAMLTVKAGDTTYNAAEHDNWDGIRVGMLEGSSRNADFADYAAEHSFTYEAVYFEDTQELVAELKRSGADRRIDAVLTSNLRRIEGEWVLTEFSASPFYIMVKKGNTELLARVNSAISQLDACEPGLRTFLMNKYYTPDNGSEIAYTPAERAYIAQMQGQTISALINPDRAPYSWVENGEMTGVIYDTAQEIIKRSGLDIRFLETDTREAYRQAVENRAAPLRFDTTDSYSQADRFGCWLTGAYITVPLAMLFHEETTSFVTAAIPENLDIADNYAKDFAAKGYAITFYGSVADTIEAVKDGKQDVAFLAMDTATLAVRDDVTNRLVAEEVFGDELAFCISVDNTQNPLLFSVLSKAAASIGKSQTNAIRQTYVGALEKPFSLIGFIYDHPSGIAIIAGVLLVIVVMLVIIGMQRRRARAEKSFLQKEQQHNEQLTAALAATEKADLAKSQFLSRMSHEIRTPLNAIIGYSTIARNEMAEARTDAEHRQADMKVMDCLTKSDVASKHLLTIINDVLDMSAIESGKIKIVNDKFDFKGLISSLTTVFYSQAKAKNVDMDVMFDTQMDEWVCADQMRINQVLTNLLSNAVKFTPEGGRVLLSICPKTEKDTISTTFEVKDTGIGMTEDGLARLWKPFEQADTSISRRFGGTGLGLSITKTLVELMGGTIEVESEPNVGTTFRVQLTLTRTEQPETLGAYDFSRINALIVDDDQSTCDYMRLLLSRSNVRSTAVTSGEAALAVVAQALERKDPYTVCFVDWRMPKMDGIETARRIREETKTDLPIIVITAYDYTEVVDKAGKLGVSRFLTKPLFQSSLFNLLAEICGTPTPHEADRAASYDFAGAHILLAEDNAMNMEIANRILGAAALRVDGVVDGQQAVDAFLNAPPGTYKAILMDVQMPVMDGYAATRTIRTSSHPEAASIPIIAMTADAFAENIAESREAGMNDHISKPIDLPTLFTTLQKYI